MFRYLFGKDLCGDLCGRYMIALGSLTLPQRLRRRTTTRLLVLQRVESFRIVSIRFGSSSRCSTARKSVAAGAFRANVSIFLPSSNMVDSFRWENCQRLRVAD